MSHSPKKIIFVTGKGGVGKSTVALSVALKLAAHGSRTLLVELGDRSFLKTFLNLEKMEYKPQSLAANLDASLLDVSQCLREYVGFYLKVEKIYNLFFKNKVIQEIIQSAPSLKELALLGKITAGPRKIGPEVPYDYIIVDSFSTGHHKTLMGAPQSIGDVFPSSAMGHQCEEMTAILKDNSLIKTILVTTAEELPVIETLEFYKYLQDNWGEPLVFCNKRTMVEIEGADSASEKVSHILEHIKEKKKEEAFYFQKLKENIPNIQILSEHLSFFGRELAEEMGGEIRYEEII